MDAHEIATALKGRSVEAIIMAKVREIDARDGGIPLEGFLEDAQDRISIVVGRKDQIAFFGCADPGNESKPFPGRGPFI